jgi:hypothetical protein
MDLTFFDDLESSRIDDPRSDELIAPYRSPSSVFKRFQKKSGQLALAGSMSKAQFIGEDDRRQFWATLLSALVQAVATPLTWQLALLPKIWLLPNVPANPPATFTPTAAPVMAVS